MNLLAPAACSSDYPAPCGAPVRVRFERWDGRGEVFVGSLVCDAGHEWIDMRNEDTPRPHGWVARQQRLPFVSPKTKRPRSRDDDEDE